MSAMRVSSRESDGRSMTLTGKPTAPITFEERFFERKAGKDRARRPLPSSLSNQISSLLLLFSSSLPADRRQHLREAVRVRLFGARKRLEPVGDLGEALLAGGLREARVPLRGLVRLGLDG